MEDTRASKRMKSEELHVDDENWTSDNGGTYAKARHGSTSLSNNTAGNQRKYNNHKDLSGEAKKRVISDMNEETHVPGTPEDDLLLSGKCEDQGSARKRKAKEDHGSQVHTEPISSSGRRHLESGDFIEEMCESEHRKEKKARVSMSGGKDTKRSKTSVDTERKSRSKKDQHNGQYLSNQASDYLKSDIGAVHPSVAANSSSSKVSGSHKNKTSGQEVKGSPVESVSSSPLRFPNADKVTITTKKFLEKDDFHESRSLAVVSPRKLSGAEDGGNDRAGMLKNDATVPVSDHATNVYNNDMCESNQYAGVKHSSERCKVEEKTNADQSQSSEFHSKKSGKGFPSRSKDKGHASGSDLNKAHTKAFDSTHDSLDNMHSYDDKSKSRRKKSDEKSGTSIKGEKFICKKETAGAPSSENSKGQSHKKFSHDGQDATKSIDKKHNLQQDHENGKLPKKSKQPEVYGNGKSHSLPPLARNQTETVANLQPVSGSQKENGVKSSTVDPLENGDALKPPSQRKKAENLNGQPTRHPTPNTHKVGDAEAPSPLRRDSSSHAANTALKEAKNLKHLADRLKVVAHYGDSGFVSSISAMFCNRFLYCRILDPLIVLGFTSKLPSNFSTEHLCWNQEVVKPRSIMN